MINLGAKNDTVGWNALMPGTKRLVHYKFDNGRKRTVPQKDRQKLCRIFK